MDTTAETLLQHLHRGGSYAFWWTAPDKRSHWWHVGTPSPVPNGHRDVYFGVHPVSTIPATNSRGETARPEAVRSQIAVIAAINCLYAEFDYKDFASPAASHDHVDELLPPPSVIIASGGGLHCYWLLAHPYLLDTPERRERAQHAQADFVLKIGGDPGAKDLARVLRLPGTRNYKPKYAPNFPEVAFTRANFHWLYALDDLIARRQPRPERVPFVARVETNEAAKAQQAIERLSLARRENYAEWIEVGKALYKLGDEGLRLWEAWSSGSAKYRAGECERKWRTFANVTSRTLGSLFHWADEDDPSGKPRKVTPLARTVSRTKDDPRVTAAPAEDRPPPISIEAARALIRTTIEDYLANPLPTYVLVICAPPGIGKSHLAVAAAEAQAAIGRRVLYCAPRRDFFVDIVEASRRLHSDDPAWEPEALWYPWQGRTTQDEDGATPCAYPEAMSAWLQRGHSAMSLCSNPKVCGWKYVSGDHACRYHRQKGITQPIIFAQHAHAVLGHPLLETCHVVIGDEDPHTAFESHTGSAAGWKIPKRFIRTAKAPIDEPMTELLHDLERLCDGETLPLSGPALIEALGGPAAVLEACASFSVDPLPPKVTSAAGVEKADYNHVITLAALLAGEAEQLREGRQYLDRVVAHKDGLTLLCGRGISPQLPPHVIWLDATGNEHLYKELFYPRPVHILKPDVALAGRIHVVTDRANGKHALMPEAEDGPQLTPQLAQLYTTIAHIASGYGQRAPYVNPALITYKALNSLDWTGDIPAQLQRLHFYGSRGSNALEGCDCLIVAGTPQPSHQEIIASAKMLYRRRMQAFDVSWTERDTAYNWRDSDGTGATYPVSGFWHDPDLAALHWQFCEAELIQAAHRARPLLYDVDVWLLANRPIAELEVTQLWTLRELFHAPAGIDPFVWPGVLALADRFYHERRPLTPLDLVNDLKLPERSAQRYWDHLAAAQPERWQETRALYPVEGKRASGRPRKTLVPREA